MTVEQIAFIEQIANACISLYDKYNILPSLTIAQAIVESNWGKSSLSSKYYNFFGMKWTSTCGCNYAEYKTKEWDKKTNQYITITAKFRSYSSYSEGIEGYYKFISGYKRYKNLIGEIDSKTACINIQKDGWATSPVYADTLYNTVINYDLMKYDDVVLHRTQKPAEYIIPEVTPSDTLYTVEKGDTLWGISKKFLGSGIKWRIIADYNGITGTMIKIGQILKIPK